MATLGAIAAPCKAYGDDRRHSRATQGVWKARSAAIAAFSCAIGGNTRILRSVVCGAYLRDFRGIVYVNFRFLDKKEGNVQSMRVMVECGIDRGISSTLWFEG